MRDLVQLNFDNIDKNDNGNIGIVKNHEIDNIKKTKHKKHKKWKIVMILLVVFLLYSLGSEEEKDVGLVKNDREYDDVDAQLEDLEVDKSENEVEDVELYETEEEIHISSVLSRSIWSSEYFVEYIKSSEADISKYLDLENEQMTRYANIDATQIYVWRNKKGEYHKTDNEGAYIYMGEVKDNYPNGLGSVFKVVKHHIGEDPLVAPVYVGEFKKGKYEGDGVEFCEMSDEANDAYSILLNYFSNPQDVVTKYFSYVKYIGEFKKGKYSGNGVLFQYPDYYMSMNYLLEGDQENVEAMGLNDLIFYMGDFKDGTENGTVEQYVRGRLKYKGKMKNGKYHGKGVLYNEYGEIEHKGKWKNGEIV